jgi:hypothetical protein
MDRQRSALKLPRERHQSAGVVIMAMAERNCVNLPRLKSQDHQVVQQHFARRAGVEKHVSPWCFYPQGQPVLGAQTGILSGNIIGNASNLLHIHILF